MAHQSMRTHRSGRFCQVKRSYQSSDYPSSCFNGEVRTRHPIDDCERVLLPFPDGWLRTQSPTNTTLFVNHQQGKQSYVDPRLALPLKKKRRPGHSRNKCTLKFDSLSTAADVLADCNLTSKFVVIVGGSKGLGNAVVKAIAAKQEAVIVCVSRTPPTNSQMLSRYSPPRTDCVFWAFADLADLCSVYAFSQLYHSLNWPLNFLILSAAELPKKMSNSLGWPFDWLHHIILRFWVGENAALASCNSPSNKIGCAFDRTVQVNFISHALLLRLLYPLLRQAGNGRIVFVSCEAHRSAYITDFSDLDRLLSYPPSPARFNPYSANFLERIQHYADTKCLQLLFAMALRRRIRAWSHNVEVFVSSPGNLLATELVSSAGASWFAIRLLCWLAYPLTKSLDSAASTVVFCGFHSDAQSLSSSSNAHSRQDSTFYFNNCAPLHPADVVLSVTLANSTWNLTNSSLEALFSLPSWTSPT
uniref:WW domain-containing oxidoreductase n=1 Tax=Schistocephalus solidus TaxID=70667 RepID=A0A0X3PKG4_SCHSO